MAKKINIKNYTSSVPAATSISNIEKLLVQAGARDIMKRYDDDHNTKSIAFVLPVENKALTFSLEAKTKRIYDLLLAEYTRPTERSLEICLEQAECTAWKLIYEWVHINISMILLDQAEPLEVFFPRLHDGKETYYLKLKNNGFKQLMP